MFILFLIIAMVVAILVYFHMADAASSAQNKMGEREKIADQLNNEIALANSILGEIEKMVNVSNPYRYMDGLSRAVNDYAVHYNMINVLSKQYNEYVYSIHGDLEKQRMCVNLLGGANSLEGLFYMANCSESNSGKRLLQLRRPDMVLCKAYTILGSVKIRENR